MPGDAKLGPLELPQPNQPMLAEIQLKDGEAEWRTMKVWLDAGHTPRFVFPNGAEEIRRTWRKIAEHHKDIWPQFADEGDLKRDRIGIRESRLVGLHVAKFPHIRIDEVKIRGPIIEQWPPVTQQAALSKTAFSAEKTRQLLQNFANRAYRRPATENEIDHLMAVVEKRISIGRAPLDGFKAALKAALCSPGFVYLSQETQALRLRAGLSPILLPLVHHAG